MASNRVTIQFDPSSIAESILVLDRVKPESEMLEALVPQVCLTAEMLRAANENIREIIRCFTHEGSVAVDDCWFDDELGDAADLEAAYVAFGIRELATDPHGLDDALLINALLEWLDATGCWHVRLRFGGHKATTTQIVDELGRRVPGFSAAAAKQLDAGRRDADPTRLEGAAGEFLELAGLLWPCGRTELKQAFRRLALAHHPDRNREDPESAKRFARINEGYLELAGILDEDVAR